VEPSLIFAVDEVVCVYTKPACHFTDISISYNAKVHPHLPKLTALLSGLAQRSSIEPKVIIIRSHPELSEDRASWASDWVDWHEFVRQGATSKLGRKDGEIEWKRMDFNWPLWILFSSGTTGMLSDILHECTEINGTVQGRPK